MEGKDLLQLLMTQRRLTPSGLARALKNQTKQPQIFKYLSGVATEPRRSTLAPIADYFHIPVDAFYDSELAWQTAHTLSLLPTISLPYTEAPRPTHAANEPTPIGIRADAFPPLRDTLRQLRRVLAREPTGVRLSVIAILKDVAERAEDEAFAEQMFDRIAGALGDRGNDPAPQSTNSPHHGSASK